MYTAAEAQDHPHIDEPHKIQFSQGIDTPSDDAYQVHQTKQGKPPPKPLSGFQKNQYRKPSLSTPKKSPKKYDGPVYVPAEVYKLLSPEAIFALKKYSTEAINRFAKKRSVHVTHLIDPESPLPEDITHEAEAQSVPHQFENAPESEHDPILDYMNSQCHQDEDMNNSLQAYNVMTSPPQDATLQRSINSTHTQPLLPCCPGKVSPTWITCG